MTAGRLAGQVAIVTGASSGIGRATAYALAEAGAKVAIVARSADVINAMADEINGKDGTALAYAADVADAEAVERAVTNVVHEWGRVDLLFANAGTNTKQRNLHDMSIAQWDHVIDVNLNGVLYCVRAVLPQMRRQKQGTIITLASMAGRHVGIMSGVAYGASKAGAVSLSHSINVEEKVNGVRATVILPGEVATAILDYRPNPPSAEARATMLQPEDVAETVVFVASLPHRVTIDELWITPTIQRARIAGEDAPKQE
ncbi:MAG: SDR family oxidoreductase [Thermomicrobia bacterium]|nr:SDR family oxidoreductase [Thermomicrobia bacterium]MCA1725271.1 SDR family oxidoreductase [Thermomicrobia bacterium]